MCIFLDSFHRLFITGFYRRFFDRFVERARKKVKPAVEKYGYLGLAIFVAIPLPVTGAYTGVLGAFILGMNRKKAVFAVSLGVIIAGITVTTVTFLGIEALSFFIKHIEL